MVNKKIENFRKKIGEKKFLSQTNTQNQEKYLNKLPEDFEWDNSNSVLKYSGKKICKFVPIPIKKLQDMRSGKSIIILRIYKNNTEYIKEISYSHLKSLKSLFTEEIFFPNARNADKILEYLITTLLEEITPENLTFINKTGWEKIDNKWCYFDGNKCISKNISNNYTLKFSPELSNKSIKLHRTNNINGAFHYALDLSKFAKATSLLSFSNFITGILYTAFETAECQPYFVLCIIGKQQTLKTTIAKLCCCSYEDENANIIGFSSSLSAIKSFISDENLKDTMVIIDDFHACSQTKEKREQSVKFSEIVRYSSNNISEIKKIGNENKKYSSKVTLTITGEQIQDVSSILSRCLIVEHRNIPDKTMLNKMQKNHYLFNVFFKNFIIWTAGNFDRIIDFIKSEFLRLREIRNNNTFENERLNDNFNVLIIAYKIFLSYGKSGNFISEDDYFEQVEYLKETLHNVKKRQIVLMKKCSADTNYDYVNALKYLFKSSKISIKSKPKKPFDDFDGTIKGDNLFIKKDNLLRLMRYYFNNNKITEIDIITQLKSRGILKQYSDGGSTKKIDGVRMLCIPLYELSYLKDI